MILVMLIGVVGTLIGIWGMTSSREGFLRVGTYRSALGVQYEAERALGLAMVRIQTMAASVDGSDDTANETSGKMITFLVDPTIQNGYYGICDPDECSGLVDIPCPRNFKPTDTTLDVIEQDAGANNTNVVCNFMGDSFESTQVTLVRKKDNTESGDSAIFLINVTTTNTTGKRRLLQGVAVVPYDPATNTSTGIPYLATTTRSSD